MRMCGIYGHFTSLNNDIERCNSSWEVASDIMANRGPDASGFENIEIDNFHGVICHRRLAIVDLDSRSNQPMNNDGNLISFNGEIYNYLELKKDLKEDGINFLTKSDTEVLIQGFDIYGLDFLKKIDGPFAFGHYDKTKKNITLARDIFGEKPLFYYYDSTDFLFSSSYEAVVSFLDNKLLDCNFLKDFFDSGYSKKNTLYKNIHKVNPGEAIEFNFHNKISIKKSVKNEFNFNAKNLSFDISHFEKLFIESLERRLIADVPIALLLSGGIDSSYIATIAKQELNYDFNCITIDDGMGSEKDIENAKKLTRKLNIPHHIINKDDFVPNEINNTLTNLDEIISDPAYYLQSKLISNVPNNIKVLISGDGSDEIFLSYSNYKKIFKNAKNMRDKISKEAILKTENILGKCHPKVLNIFIRASAFCPLSVNDLFILERVFSKDKEFIDNVLLKDKCWDLLHKKAIDYDLAEYLLRKADLSSTFFSKELRSPFLSKKIFKYALQCDFDSIKAGKKQHLIDSLVKRLGKDFLFEKRGFFAGGQKKITENIDIDLSFLPKETLSKIENISLNDYSLKYRSLVLKNYLSKFQDA